MDAKQIAQSVGIMFFVLTMGRGQDLAGPAFEVASIKPPAPLTLQELAGQLQTVVGTRVDFRSVSLMSLLVQAYRVKPYQISGPDWIKTQAFDIVAKMPEGTSPGQLPAMLENLLIQRFRLSVTLENREQPVYFLTLGKNGPKLKEASNLADTRVRTSVLQDNTYHITLTRSPAGLADFLEQYLDRPVIDMTNLIGVYEVALDVAREDVRRATATGRPDVVGPSSDADLPAGRSFVSAVEQLGLNLEPRRIPVRVIVITHLEKKPTEN